MEFNKFGKISRYNRKAVVTEKIDGTNAQICIGEDGEFLVGSRKRWITPEDDNYGFAKWCEENKSELVTLGPGRHFGEWWGAGIQRRYNQTEKRFSLFNVTRWCLHCEKPKRIETLDPTIEKYQERLPSCVGLVPVLWEGAFEEMDINIILKSLETIGSAAAPGFMKPEGVVVYHSAGNVLLKKTIEKDEQPKGNVAG